MWSLHWSFESLWHVAPSVFRYVTGELLHTSSPHQRLFGQIVRLFAWCDRDQNYSFGVRASQRRSEAIIAAYLSPGIRLSADSDGKQITVFVSTQPWGEKVSWWMLDCLAKQPATKTSYAGRVLWLVLGLVRQLTKTPTGHARLWTAECLRIVASWKRKKKCYSEASFVKKKGWWAGEGPWGSTEVNS